MNPLSSEQRELHASDGKAVSAYHVCPHGRVRGGLVVLQEIFGVNTHIRAVADELARHGYEVLAPALFDRVERGVELGYDPQGVRAGAALRTQVGTDAALLDVQSAIDQLAGAGKVGVVGYCWGGSLAFAAATRLRGLSAAVGYYGGFIAKLAQETPRVPVLLHFGERDQSIPLADVEHIREARPELELHTYAAGHGFNCDARGSYDAPSAELALKRTLAFFERHLG